MDVGEEIGQAMKHKANKPGTRPETNRANPHVEPEAEVGTNTGLNWERHNQLPFLWENIRQAEDDSNSNGSRFRALANLDLNVDMEDTRDMGTEDQGLEGNPGNSGKDNASNKEVAADINPPQTRAIGHEWAASVAQSGVRDDGVGGKHFLNVLKEHIRLHRPPILALLETHISGRKADRVCNNIGYQKWFQMEAWVPRWNIDIVETGRSGSPFDTIP
ncbi:hypothetical protein Cgig2_033463 [Carnegiea gigantea]|uniref:Uncharacterized protein n=1 Tax=Carnegiea gigantea TaxID=171969 RepID=A0A9Q1GYM7_9CARY|nr:hypothetical protein Cgig2_033463 [Carnegiea gigantea]